MKVKDITLLTGKSESYVWKAKKGLYKNPDPRVAALLETVEDEFKKVIANPLMWEICELAVMKGRSSDIRKFAIYVQQINQRLRTVELNNEM